MGARGEYFAVAVYPHADAVRAFWAPENDDERRRYYRITPFGLAVARAEATRLAQMIKLARARGIAPEKA